MDAVNSCSKYWTILNIISNNMHYLLYITVSGKKGIIELLYLQKLKVIKFKKLYNNMYNKIPQ